MTCCELIPSALRVLPPLAPQLAAAATTSTADRERLNQRITARCDLFVMCKRVCEAVQLRLSCDSAVPALTAPAAAGTTAGSSGGSRSGSPGLHEEEAIRLAHYFIQIQSLPPPLFVRLARALAPTVPVATGPGSSTGASATGNTNTPYSHRTASSVSSAAAVAAAQLLDSPLATSVQPSSFSSPPPMALERAVSLPTPSSPLVIASPAEAAAALASVGTVSAGISSVGSGGSGGSGSGGGASSQQPFVPDAEWITGLLSSQSPYVIHSLLSGQILPHSSPNARVAAAIAAANSGATSSIGSDIGTDSLAGGSGGSGGGGGGDGSVSAATAAANERGGELPLLKSELFYYFICHWINKRSRMLKATATGTGSGGVASDIDWRSEFNQWELDARVRALMPPSFTVFNFLQLIKQQLTLTLNTNPFAAPPPPPTPVTPAPSAAQTETKAAAAPLPYVLSPLVATQPVRTAASGGSSAPLPPPTSVAADVPIGQLRAQLLQFVQTLSAADAASISSSTSAKR